MQEEIKQEAEQTAAPEPEKQFSDEKKTALMRYMTVMFAVAFLMVLVSFLIQNHSITELSESTNNLSGRVEALQEQNRELEDENEALKQEIEALTEQHETAKSEHQETATLREKVETYEALVTALSCETKEGNLSYSNAMETLKFNQKYLSEPAKQLYRTLLTETAGE